MSSYLEGVLAVEGPVPRREEFVGLVKGHTPGHVPRAAREHHTVAGPATAHTYTGVHKHVATGCCFDETIAEAPRYF